jgi:cytochrome P450
MTEVLNATTTDHTELPAYPMVRAGGCPFDPPRRLLELNADKPLHRVRIWNGTTPWLITGYDEVRALYADPRVSVNDHLHDHRQGFPYQNEGLQILAQKRAASLVTADGLSRPEVSKHMGFGYGRHQCIGQSLARVELQIVFSTLLKRIPTLQLAVALDQIPLKHDRLAYGAYELPVTW